MSSINKKILVTGHRSFVGRYLCELLDKNGYIIVKASQDYYISDFDYISEIFSN